MRKEYKQIYNEIKKFNTIYTARHIGPDPDAIASQIGLKETIKATFPNKKVYALGTSVAKFKYLGKLDKLEQLDYENSLLVILDTPDKKRVDIPNLDKFKNIVKIDHHPKIDDFGGIELIEENSSSASQIVIELIDNTKLKMTKEIAEVLFMGVVSDSNRFLFDCTTTKTFYIVGDLIHRYKIDIQNLYRKLYAKPLSELRLMGHIASNIRVTKNNFAYIQLDDDVIKSFNADPASASNMINDLNNINEIICWVFVSRDEKNDMFRVNIRSRGPIINEVAMKYNGGGHKYASGVRTKDKSAVDNLIKELDELCKEYNEKES